MLKYTYMPRRENLDLIFEVIKVLLLHLSTLR